jgi:hypothetical protein
LYAPFLVRGAAPLSPLQDVSFFKSFTLEGHTLSWSNGADFAPEFLREHVPVFIGETHMAEALLTQAQQLINHLSLLDQARLMEYLSSRMEAAILSISSPSMMKGVEQDDPWRAFFKVGDELVSNNPERSETMTSALFAMRR